MFILSIALIIPSLDKAYRSFYITKLGGLPYPPYFQFVLLDLPRWLWITLIPCFINLAYLGVASERGLEMGIRVVSLVAFFTLGILAVYFLFLLLPFTCS